MTQRAKTENFSGYHNKFFLLGIQRVFFRILIVAMTLNGKCQHQCGNLLSLFIFKNVIQVFAVDIRSEVGGDFYEWKFLCK
jgi:hypothetical protein